jgi:hypothetical protein
VRRIGIAELRLMVAMLNEAVRVDEDAACATT